MLLITHLPHLYFTQKNIWYDYFWVIMIIIIIVTIVIIKRTVWQEYYNLSLNFLIIIFDKKIILISYNKELKL